MFLNIPV